MDLTYFSKKYYEIKSFQTCYLRTAVVAILLTLDISRIRQADRLDVAIDDTLQANACLLYFDFKDNV